ncbi:hypothetical protein ACH4GK_24290 [Streptomyces rimosus]|uniref:hypothetical protein n=1 Tax=Streptomyces rimosus TaxID=1927 RepID=UPI0004C61ED3|nr:hypothetical protein [Streptomyces rimosus]
MSDTPLYCSTCKKEEPHRSPEGEREKQWLRRLTGKGYVDDYWICTRPGCRNIRYRWEGKTFDPPERMPIFD